MQIIAKAAEWVYAFTCWKCNASLEANANDLVYTEDYVGEDSHKTKNYCVDCPNCGEATTVPKENCTFDAMKLARSKGLRNGFDKNKFTPVSY